MLRQYGWGWIPRQAKGSPQHEPRNGLLMCRDHHIAFNSYEFYICLVPRCECLHFLFFGQVWQFNKKQIGKYVLIKHSDNPNLDQYHGKLIALDPHDHHAPFPSLFIIHEIRVRGFDPLQLICPDIPDIFPWQDWLSSGGLLDNTSGYFVRTPRTSLSLTDDGNDCDTLQPQMSPGGGSSGPTKVFIMLMPRYPRSQFS